MTDPHPLKWPEGWPRTPSYLRSGSRYRQLDLRVTREELLNELDLMMADNVVMSMNVRFGPRWPEKLREEPEDPGVCLYWTRGGQEFNLPIDQWRTVAENLRAVLLAVQAMRQLERCGAPAVIQRAQEAFAALPAKGESGETVSEWRQVLGFTSDERVTRKLIEERFRRLARQRHPDTGGSTEAFTLLNNARVQANEEIRE